MEKFADVLFREASSLNPDVEQQSVRDVVEVCDLSWMMIEDQRKEVVVERLRTIGNLDDSQCNQLFETLNGMVPVDRKAKGRTHFLNAKKNFYEKWIMKRMSNPSVFTVVVYHLYIYT